MSSRALSRLVLAVTALAVALYLLRTVAPTLLPLTPRGWFIMGAIGKLAFQAIAVAASWAAASRLFGGEDGIGRAWRFLAVGLAGFFLGQAVLAYHQISRGQAAPFPSVADVFFLLGYPFLIAALDRFVVSFRAAGWPLGEPSADRRRMLTVAAIGLVVLAPLLVPILRSSDEALPKAINLAYPLLDLALLAPAWLVLQVAQKLSGGAVRRVWWNLFIGVAALVASDVAFGYISSLGFKGLEPIMDALYFVGYGSLALAPLAQHSLARE